MEVSRHKTALVAGGVGFMRYLLVILAAIQFAVQGQRRWKSDME